jgi:TonB family protein
MSRSVLSCRLSRFVRRCLLGVAVLTVVPALAQAHENTAPVLQNKAAPVYPPAALEAGIEGTVVLHLYLDARGAVEHVEVVSTPGHGLEDAAISAAKQFHFKPASSDGEPVASQVVYEQRFAINRVVRGELTGDQPVIDAMDHPEYESVVVARGPMTSASASTVRDLDFELRPRSSPNDILRVVPGLVTAQHQGGGKADQIFLRGFDADHGTDVAVFIDGIPINMPSHAHGQGFADLHFVIPEVLQTVEVYKGAYYPQFGDFDTAGAVNLVTRTSFDRSFVSVTGGWYRLEPGHFERDANALRFLGVAAPHTERLHAYIAVEAAKNDGPFVVPEGLERYNLFAKAAYDVGDDLTVGAMATAYGSGWTGSGQIPSRLIGTPELPTRFGALDPTEGGSTQRSSATAFLHAHPDPLSRLTLRAYVIDYKLALFNDFTFFLANPTLGDEIEQDDARTVTGLAAEYEVNRRWRGIHFKSTLGAQLRRDDVHLDLWDVTSQQGAFRKRVGRHSGRGDPAVGSSNADELLENISFYLAEDVLWTRWLRTVVGLRGDYFSFDVADRDEQLGAGNPKTSGLFEKSLLSPKASAILTPRQDVDLYLNFGTGFHSNDARLAVRASDPTLPQQQKIRRVFPRAYEGELGARMHLYDRFDVGAALWYVYLQSETVFEGDAGVFSPSDPTRRYGADLELRCRLLPWLFADADVALAHAEFVADRGNGGAVALAPRVTYGGGLTARHPSGWKAALRVRGVGDRPIVDPGDEAAFRAAGRPVPQAEGYIILDAFAGYGSRRWELVAALENALDTSWREAQFANRSCSRAENASVASPCSQRDATGALRSPDAVLPDVHFAPGNPINVTLTGKVFF